jgi:predicted MFS family arabinose efflux permease
MMGLLAMSGCGLANLASAIGGLSADASLSLLVVGRLLTGIAQGLIVTGGAAWAIGLAGTAHAGRAMSWLGLAMFAGLAAGAALGTALDQAFSFLVVTAAMILLPLAALLGARFIASSGQRRDLSPVPIIETIVTIWRPGLTLALSSVGYASVTSFVVLDFNAQRWSGGGMALVAFSVGHVAARVGFGAIVDRIKGPVAAAITLAVEAVGLGFIWAAPNPTVALAGAAISGFGFSMVYPLLAIAALRRVPPSRIGATIGIYNAYYDVAMGLSGFLSGALAEWFGITAPFLFAGAASIVAIVVAVSAYGQGQSEA